MEVVVGGGARRRGWALGALGLLEPSGGGASHLVVPRLDEGDAEQRAVVPAQRDVVGAARDEERVNARRPLHEDLPAGERRFRVRCVCRSERGVAK